MRNHILILFWAAILVGCDEKDRDQPSEVPVAEKIDLSGPLDLTNTEVVDQLLEIAKPKEWLQERGEGEETRFFEVNQEEPFSGWVKDRDEFKLRNYFVVYQVVDGKRDGPFLSRFSNRRHRVSVSYKSGKLEGPAVFQYEDGRKRKVCTFSGGEVDGKFESWYPSGQKRFIATYKDGVPWEAIGWEENGERSITDIVDGTGPFVRHEDSGDKSYAGSYKNGLRHGEWSWWDRFGSLEERATYEDGIRVLK